MSEQDNIRPPLFSDILLQYGYLIDQTVSRDGAADWARRWTSSDDPPDMDDNVWNALTFLSFADAISTDRPFLYSIDEYKSELEKLLLLQ